MELVNPNTPYGNIRHALFDFDGTLSLIREGWRDVMIPLMVELLLQTPGTKARQSCARSSEFADRLTGKQMIYQMIRLCEEIDQRGGKAADPLEYTRMYHARLWARIEHSVGTLKASKVRSPPPAATARSRSRPSHPSWSVSTRAMSKPL